MTNKYKCESHYLDVACINCFKAVCLKYEKLLKLAKEFHKSPSDEFIVKTRDLLREIGDLDERVD